MRTNIIAYVASSDKRKRIVSVLLDRPGRQWSCPAIEEATGISHATVFRTLNELVSFSVLKTVKLSKRNIVFELVKTPVLAQIEYVIEAERNALIDIAKSFVSDIYSKDIASCILFGSVAKGTMTKDSDIDILVLTKKTERKFKNEILNRAAEVSSDFNKTISVTVMSKKQFSACVKKKEPFAIEVLKEGVVLYGKKLSGAG